MPRVAVVTGASSGVGRATVRLLARNGYDLGLVARGLTGLQAAAAEVEAEGRRACVVPADVADAQAVERCADAVERRLGPVSLWVNSAMVSVLAPVAKTTAEEVRRVTEVNYLGAVHGTMAALRRMRPRGRGVIVQVGSALAYRSIPLQAAYCASKHAILGFTESLRCELLHDRSPVRVVMVQLPAINTPHFQVVRSRLAGRPRPMAPVYQPELAARAILAAAGGSRRELVFGRMAAAAVAVDRLAPGLGDRYLALTGYEAQQLDVPDDPARRDNLFEPVERDAGARGPFAAFDRSGHLTLQIWRWPLLLAGAVVAGLLVGARRRCL